MERTVRIYFDGQSVDVYLDNLDENATPKEIRDIAYDTFDYYSYAEIMEA